MIDFVLHWSTEAACSKPDYSPTWWDGDNRDEAKLATDICREECAFQETCLSSALARKEEWGIWGGRNLRSIEHTEVDPGPRKLCKRGHDQAEACEVVGNVPRCGVCYREAQARGGERRKAARRAARAAKQLEQTLVDA